MKFNPPNIWKNTKIEEKNEFFDDETENIENLVLWPFSQICAECKHGDFYMSDSDLSSAYLCEIFKHPDIRGHCEFFEEKGEEV